VAGRKKVRISGVGRKYQDCKKASYVVILRGGNVRSYLVHPWEGLQGKKCAQNGWGYNGGMALKGGGTRGDKGVILG